MCGGGGGGGVSEQLAVQQANDEQARQDRIREGMRQIELMFNGGRTTTGQLGTGARYDPNATYYDKNGNAWSPGDLNAYRSSHGLMADNTPYTMGYTQYQGGDAESSTYYPGNGPAEYAGAEYRDAVWNGNSGADSSYSPAGYYRNGQYIGTGPATMPGSAQADEALRQKMFEEALGGGLYTGVQDNAGYNDEFYNKSYQAQLDYALPQVDEQFAKAQRDLEFALARQGLNQSSQGTSLRDKLTSDRSIAIQQVQDQANQVRARQQQAVEDERSNLTAMLQQTGDVQSTMNAAAARKSLLDAAPALETIGPLFQNATGGLADMIVNPALRTAANKSNTGYGINTGSSGKVVN